MAELSQATQRLINKYQSQYFQAKEGAGKIHVDEVASRVAKFYEKMRGVIDWREEHLLRKTAVERILKRRLFLKRDAKEISEPFVHELIRGGHFPNDTIPEPKIAEIQKSIEKYVYILENAPRAQKEKMRTKLFDWLLGIAACEVEEILASPVRQTALIDFMLEVIKDKITSRLDPEEKNIQTYIAIQRALFKLDPPIISYNLLKKWFEQWFDLPQDKLDEIAKNIYYIWEKIEKNLHHPLSEKFYSICERYDTAYLILGDVASADPASARKNLENPEVLEAKIKEDYRERLKKVKKRLRRAAFYSTLSIFLSKMLLAFAVEVPFDKYITGEFNYSTMGMNILIPPLLMVFLVLSIRPPSKQNEQLVIMEIMKIAYEKERKDVYEIRVPKKIGFILNSIIALIYLLSFFASFGLIIWGLKKLNFSLISIIIFLAFTSLISFAGIKIRQRAKELNVEKDKETFFRTFIDLFSMPIIQVGKWLSTQWQKYNAIVVIFNSLLDMPFQVFIEFLEQWRSFLQEKKEEIH